MDILILKTNVENKIDFEIIKRSLSDTFQINECTIDLQDNDKVLRVIGSEINIDEVVGKVKDLGYFCEELNY